MDADGARLSSVIGSAITPSVGVLSSPLESAGIRLGFGDVLETTVTVAYELGHFSLNGGSGWAGEVWKTLTELSVSRR
jgi:hypothetical protein